MQIMQPSWSGVQAPTLDNTTTVVGKPYPVPGHRNTITMLEDGTWQVTGARRKAPLKGHIDRSGRPTFGLTTEGGARVSMQIGRAVLLVFKGQPPPNTECCHWDGNPANNHPDNLRWGTKTDNSNDRVRHGMCHWQKLTDEQVEAIRDAHAGDLRYSDTPPEGSQRWLMDKYQLSRTTISRILRGLPTGIPSETVTAIRLEYTGPEPRSKRAVAGNTYELASAYGITPTQVQRIVKMKTRAGAAGQPKVAPVPSATAVTWTALASGSGVSPSQFSRIAQGLSRTMPEDAVAAGIRARLVTTPRSVVACEVEPNDRYSNRAERYGKPNDR